MENQLAGLFFYPSKDDYGQLLENLRLANSFAIVFPDDNNFEIPLRGSSAALEAASRCWQEKPTGVVGDNPFSGSDSSGENPFN